MAVNVADEAYNSLGFSLSPNRFAVCSTTRVSADVFRWKNSMRFIIIGFLISGTTRSQPLLRATDVAYGFGPGRAARSSRCDDRNPRLSFCASGTRKRLRPMQLIDTVTVRYEGHERSVMLFVGNLAKLPESEAVDALIVSAFPDDYTPTDTSLIGALDCQGVSVASLSRDKEVDLRRFSSCWLSRPLGQKDVHFRRVLCFEPAHRGPAPEVVGDIFRSIVPFATGDPPIAQVAMPLLASGDQWEPVGAGLGKSTIRTRRCSILSSRST